MSEIEPHMNRTERYRCISELKQTQYPQLQGKAGQNNPNFIFLCTVYIIKEPAKTFQRPWGERSIMSVDINKEDGDQREEVNSSSSPPFQTQLHSWATPRSRGLQRSGPPEANMSQLVGLHHKYHMLGKESRPVMDEDPKCSWHFWHTETTGSNRPHQSWNHAESHKVDTANMWFLITHFGTKALCLKYFWPAQTSSAFLYVTRRCIFEDSFPARWWTIRDRSCSHADLSVQYED